MFPVFMHPEVSLIKQEQLLALDIAVIIFVSIQNTKLARLFTFGENLYFANGEQDYDNNETGTRSNLVNVIKMMPYMPVHDPTTSDGYRGVNSVLDGGDPTNPIEDALVKNPGTRTTVKVLGTAYH